MKDVIVVIADTKKYDGEDSEPYVATKVFRYDYEGTDKELIDAVEGLSGIIEGSQMKNE